MEDSDELTWQKRHFKTPLGKTIDTLLTVVHQRILQLRAWEANSFEVFQHQTGWTRVHHISQTQIGDPIQKWEHIGPRFFHGEDDDSVSTFDVVTQHGDD